MKNISVEELHKKLQDKEIDPKSVIDVRTPAENEEEKIANTILIPLNELQNTKLNFDKNEALYIYCRTGNRSQIACHLLEAQGFTNCYNVEGGIEEWKAKGLETEKGEKRSFLGLF